MFAGKSAFAALAALVGLSPIASSYGETCLAASAPHSTALLELYTSEGCNSCPPADVWVGGLRAGGFSRERVVPLALHVDYWNGLGWIDPFSRKEFSTRQRELNSSGFVFTPQVLLNGRNYRWGNAATLSRDLDALNRVPARAEIRLTLEKAAASRELHIAVTGVVPDPALRRDAALYAAVYESAIVNSVPAGENAGSTLRHDYVVREWLGPFPVDSGAVALDRTVTLVPQWRPVHLGVAAFVQNRRNGDVLQALALPWCGGT